MSTTPRFERSNVGQWLTGSAAGLVCLTIGGGLAAVGLVWSDTLADRAGRLR